MARLSGVWREVPRPFAPVTVRQTCLHTCCRSMRTRGWFSETGAFPPGMTAFLAGISGILGRGRAERLLGQGARGKAHQGLVGRRDPSPPWCQPWRPFWLG